MLLPRLDLRHSIYLLAAACLGCGPGDQIAKYTVPKPELIDPTLTAIPKEPPQQQLLGAIVPMPKDDAGNTSSWFFKMAGDPAVIEPNRQVFLDFVKSITFSKGQTPQPTWKLPPAWRELEAKQFGFATVGFDSGGQTVEIAISTAGGDLLTNVNRWRRQLGLRAIREQDVPASVEKIQVDGREGVWLSLRGTGGGGMGGAPFAAGSDKTTSAPRAAPPANATVASSGGIVFTAPEQWSPGKLKEFRKAAFVVSAGDQSAEITVIDLDAAAGDLVSNVNRWRGMVGLAPATEGEIKTAAKKIETLGVLGDYVELVGPGDGRPQSILGVMAVAGGKAWFIKLQGARDLAAREKDRFESFVKSVKFK